MTQELADNIKRLRELYSAMVAEGEAIAAERQNILGGYEFDKSEYIKLRDYQPARTAWKNAQPECLDAINQLVELVAEMREALADSKGDIDTLTKADALLSGLKD